MIFEDENAAEKTASASFFISATSFMACVGGWRVARAHGITGKEAPVRIEQLQVTVRGDLTGSTSNRRGSSFFYYQGGNAAAAAISASSVARRSRRRCLVSADGMEPSPITMCVHTYIVNSEIIRKAAEASNGSCGQGKPFPPSDS